MPTDSIFAPVFKEAHGYLALMHLCTPDARDAVELVRTCCRSNANPQPEIRRLLEDLNWRPHLVASVAAILCGHDPETVKHLWRRFDCGSWVTPQIGVALYLTDSDFADQARSRLESGCQVDLTELRSMTAIERHSAAGPAGGGTRSAKSAATLLQLVRSLSPVPDWVQEVSATRQMQDLLEQDRDGSARIAGNWLERMRKLSAPG